MTFAADAIARRFASREGCRFVGYTAVGIAVFDMNVRAARNRIESCRPIDEFAIRFIAEGITSVMELGSFFKWKSNFFIIAWSSYVGRN